MSDEQRHKDRIEGFKLYFDLLKHLTTVSTASILIIAALVERVFKSPVAMLLVALSVAAFLLCIGMAVFGMLGYAAKVRMSNPIDDENYRTLGQGSALTCLLSFIVGVGSLGGFALANLL